MTSADGRLGCLASVPKQGSFGANWPSTPFFSLLVHIGERDRWPQLHIIDQIILRNFVLAAVNAQRLDFTEKQCLSTSFT